MEQQKCSLLGECEVAQSLWKTVWQGFSLFCLTKLNVVLTYVPAIILLGITQKRQKHIHTQTYTEIFMYLVTTVPKATKMFFTKWKDKLWYIYTMKCYLGIKQNKLYTQEPQCVFHIARSQSEKAMWFQLNKIIVARVQEK